MYSPVQLLEFGIILLCFREVAHAQIEQGYFIVDRVENLVIEPYGRHWLEDRGRVPEYWWVSGRLCRGSTFALLTMPLAGAHCRWAFEDRF